MKTIVLDDFSASVVMAALSEMAWNTRNEKAGANYETVKKDIKKQLKEQ